MNLKATYFSASTAVTTPCSCGLVRPGVASASAFQDIQDQDEEVLPDNLIPLRDLVLDKRIIGGTEVPVNRYPWIASVFVTNSSGRVGLCGGTIISTRHILTGESFKTIIQ